jgi:NAD-dependent SIR2 family protein deacetylase
MALGVSPNDGHRALAKLADKQPGFLCLTQNVDSEL